MRRSAHASRSNRVAGLVVLSLVAALSMARPTPAAGSGCGDLPVSVDCGAGTDPSNGYFHGLIGVTGQDWVLGVASHSGTSPGCGDCIWTIALDCPHTSPGDPNSSVGCGGFASGSRCPDDQLPFNLYLTTSSVIDELMGVICLGGETQIVEVGEDADSDVQRYMGDVTPPDLGIHHRPHGATLTGLDTYFHATIPAESLGPVSFGGGTVSESITLVPRDADWHWGDGTSSGWLPVGATADHRYLTSGVEHGTLTTRWTATYTATFEGQTVGPFPATGEVLRSQPFIEPVDTSRPVLVGPGVPLA
ncbi:MAG: hypothetical protein ACTHK4_11065 [Mycobacteriales bacterium]